MLFGMCLDVAKTVLGTSYENYDFEGAVKIVPPLLVMDVHKFTLAKYRAW